MKRRSDLIKNLVTDSSSNETLDDSFFIRGGVQKSSESEIRTRVDTLLYERGIKWVEVYGKLGWSKSFASEVRNGKLVPPLWQRVALSKELGIDSSVIWGDKK